jgi:protein transport protein SEC24
MSKKTNVIMGAVMQPLAESPDGKDIPVVNFGASSKVIRCKDCRAYINPFVQFIENGRRWKCNMCHQLNDVPKPYFCHLDSNNQRADIGERPELRMGQVEFVAPGDYMVRPPQAPCFVFVIDVSIHAIQSGILDSTVAIIRRNLNQLPGNPRTQVGFITFDKVIHFYNLKHTLNAPQMMVVSDLNDIFLPVPEDLLVNLSESANIIDTLLDELPEMFKGNSCRDAALGAAVNAAFLTMSHIGGKMCVFQASLPTIGPGALKRRDNPKLLGTEQEHKLLCPENPYYQKKATELIKHQIGVDLFLFSGEYTDVATLANLPKYTGGTTYYYPGFNPTRDGERFSQELERTLTREMAWEAVARVRITNGMRITNFFGNYQFRGKDLLALPNFSADSTFSCEFVHEKKVLQTDTVCLQSALLYTTSLGERRIRVNTIALPTTNSEIDVFKSVRMNALCNLMMKKACDRSVQAGISSGRMMLQNDCTNVVRGQRMINVSNNIGGYTGIQQSQSPSQGINLPEQMTLLPLNTMALMKSLAFRGGNSIRSDERSYIYALISVMPITQSIPFIYPRMYALHTMSETAGRILEKHEDFKSGALRCFGGDVIEMPKQLGLTAERLSSEGCFLLDNGIDIFLWIGQAMPSKLISSLFGLETLNDIDCNQLRLENGHDKFCTQVHNIVRACRAQNPSHGTLRVVRENGPLESRFFMHLVEDRANFSGGAFSYAEFMDIMQRQSSGMIATNASTLQRRY